MLFPFRFHLKQMHSKSISRPHFARSYALTHLFDFFYKIDLKLHFFKDYKNLYYIISNG